MVGRYVKFKEVERTKPWTTWYQKSLKIEGKSKHNTLYIEGFGATNYPTGDYYPFHDYFELMPEGWTPDNVDNNSLLNLQIW